MYGLRPRKPEANQPHALSLFFPYSPGCSHHCQIFFERIGTHQGSFLALLAVILYLAQWYQRKIPELGKKVGEEESVSFVGQDLVVSNLWKPTLFIGRALYPSLFIGICISLIRTRMSRTSFRLLQNSTSCTSSILHFAQVSSESMPDTVEDARHSSTHADSGESNIDSTVPTMPLKSTSSPECASNPPLSCTPGTNDEQRKAAAAEARLRRRKVLARRNSQSPRRSAVSFWALFLGSRCHS